MTETEKRMHRVCFTGHRPEKLTRHEKSITKDLEKEIRQAVADGLNVFITGMARGVDIWAAQIVLLLRDEGYDVKLMCACPYDGFERGWSQEWQRQYKEILASADFVKYVCEGYSRACFQTVSYTHLDVYKRQVWDCTERGTVYEAGRRYAHPRPHFHR